jgi:hypothetical protein
VWVSWWPLYWWGASLLRRALYHPERGALRPGSRWLRGASETTRDVLRVLGCGVLCALALGMCSGLRIDYDVLHVYFDERGELERTGVFQH